jgi:hypothetical protein
VGANAQAKAHPPAKPSRGSYNQGTGGPQKCEYGGGAANQYQGTGQGQGGGGNGGQGYVDNKLAVINIGGKTSTKGEDHPPEIGAQDG